MRHFRFLLLASAAMFAPPDAGAGGTPPTDGGAGGTSPPNNAGTPPPPGSGGGAPDWFTKLSSDPEMKTWAESKGWKDPTSTDPYAVAQSYYNLEKLFGADKAGRTIMLPKDANDTAAFDAIYEKLGRPKDAAGYQLDLPEGADPAFTDAAKGWFHKAGLTATQAKAVADSYRAMELDAAKRVEDAHAQQVEAMQREWGGEYERKVEIGRAAAKAAGMAPEDVKAVELSLGPAKAAKYLEFFGRNYIEAGPPGNETRGGNFGNLTPGAAQQKMSQLYADPAFMERYNSNSPKVREAAIAEMDALARLAVNAKV